MSASTPLLDVAGVDAGYGRSQVLFGMSLTVHAGGCTSLLGRNGMGKSTTIKALMGLIRPTRGEIRWRGTPVQARAPHAIARLGIGLVPEGRQVFPNLTVRENLVATAASRTGVRTPWTLARVHALFPRLAERGSHFGNQLSGGEQQMLAIGRALMTNPALLILDEATEGLAPLIRQQIWNALAQIKSEGTAILVVDKNIVPLLGIADRHTVVEKGQVAWTGTTDELRANASVLQRYLAVDGPGEERRPHATSAIAAEATAAEDPAGTTLLESLYREHRSIVAALDTLSLIVRRSADEGGPLEVPTLHAILHYFDIFPERHHHPKEEEFLFPAIRARTAEANDVIGRLERQHVAGDQALEALQQKLLRAEHGAGTDVQAFLTAARTFIEAYRQHLDIEESVLMPIARRALPREDWVRIERQFRGRVDPLELEDGPVDPQALLQRIVALAPAPLGFGSASRRP